MAAASSPSDGAGAGAGRLLAAKLAAGGLSCMISSGILNPMDVVKVRLQTQNQLMKLRRFQTGHHMGQYKGFLHALQKIFHEEGFWQGLMKGLTASMLREASYSSIRLGLYDSFKQLFAPHATKKDDFTLIQKILAGGCSGAIGSAIANPTDLVKIRFQATTPNTPALYRHTFHAFVSIYRNEKGLRGLYKGVGPTTVRASVLTAAQLASYDHSKRYMLSTPYFSDTPSTHLIASIISGLVTTTATNPVDIVKTRVMTDRSLYKGPVDCFVKIVTHEGPLALMKGWVPNYMRLGPHFIMSIPLLEFLRKMFGADTV